MPNEDDAILPPDPDDELEDEHPLEADNPDAEDAEAVELPDPSPRNDMVPDPDAPDPGE